MNKQEYNELLVIKVGTSTLSREDCIDWPALDTVSFRRIGQQVIHQTEKGVYVAVVSSGAIAAGYAYSGEERTEFSSNDILEKQRYACLGQVTLMREWQKALAPKKAGQLVFSRREMETAEGVELTDVTERMFERGDIPVANENNALTHEQISFGDNDTLAALNARLLVKSGLFAKASLILLSDVNGVYRDINDPESVIDCIEDIDAIQHLGGESGSKGGTGGMKSKFEAARIATDAGIDTYIGNGRTANVIQRVLNRDEGTHFTAS